VEEELKVSERAKGEGSFCELVLSELATCGVASETVAVEYDSALDDFSFRIRRTPSVLDASQLACIARLQVAGAISFEDPETEAKFRLAADIALMTKMREDARVWLAQHNLLEGLPVFDPTASDLASYAQRLESHCGFPPGSALEVSGPKSLTIRHGLPDPGTLRGDALQRTFDVLERIRHAVAASNLSDHGIKLFMSVSASEGASAGASE
jgi:hypothetical protein